MNTVMSLCGTVLKLFYCLPCLHLSCPTQAEFSTPLLPISSPSLRQWWHALNRELSWPTRVSSTWPGRVGWMSVTPAGWETGVSATPSTFVGHSVEGVFLGCELFTSTRTRRDTHFLSPAMMPSATQVGHHLDKALNAPILSLVKGFLHQEIRHRWKMLLCEVDLSSSVNNTNTKFVRS